MRDQVTVTQDLYTPVARVGGTSRSYGDLFKGLRLSDSGQSEEEETYNSPVEQEHGSPLIGNR
jgi:hypothetical protein